MYTYKTVIFALIKSVNDKVRHGAVGFTTRDIPMKYCLNSVFIGVSWVMNLAGIDSNWQN